MKAGFLKGMLFFFGAATASLQAEFVVNGDFSTPVPLNGTGGGWSSFNNDVNGGHRDIGGNPEGMFILNSNGALGTDPAITQTLTGLTVGATYDLSGDFRSIYVFSGSASPVFAVTIGGSVVFQAFSSPGSWTAFTGSFVAAESNPILSISAEMNGTDIDMAVDNISVMDVPEYASFSSAMGVAAFFFIACRRSRGTRAKRC